MFRTAINWESYDEPFFRLSLPATETTIRRSSWPAFALAILTLPTTATLWLVSFPPPPQFSNHCQIRLSVIHILVDCPPSMPRVAVLPSPPLSSSLIVPVLSPLRFSAVSPRGHVFVLESYWDSVERLTLFPFRGDIVPPSAR